VPLNIEISKVLPKELFRQALAIGGAHLARNTKHWRIFPTRTPLSHEKMQ